MNFSSCNVLGNCGFFYRSLVQFEPNIGLSCSCDFRRLEGSEKCRKSWVWTSSKQASFFTIWGLLQRQEGSSSECHARWIVTQIITTMTCAAWIYCFKGAQFFSCMVACVDKWILLDNRRMAKQPWKYYWNPSCTRGRLYSSVLLV